MRNLNFCWNGILTLLPKNSMLFTDKSLNVLCTVCYSNAETVSFGFFPFLLSVCQLSPDKVVLETLTLGKRSISSSFSMSRVSESTWMKSVFTWRQTASKTCWLHENLLVVVAIYYHMYFFMFGPTSIFEETNLCPL